MDLDALKRRLSVDLETARTELQAAQARFEQLTTAWEGLQIIEETYITATSGAGQPADRSPAASVLAVSVQRPSNADLVQDVVTSLGRPAMHDEITDRVRENTGLPFTPEQTRNALRYLREKQKVRKVGVGRWEALPAPSPKQGSVPAASAAGTSKAGENGASARGGDVLTGARLAPHPAEQASF
jgi:hypothetical protein